MKTKIYLTALIGLCYSWNIAIGQSFNLEPMATEKCYFGLKASLPNLKYTDEYMTKLNAFSGVYTFYSSINIKDNVGIYAELPIVYSSYDGGDNNVGLGNILIAVKAWNLNQTSQFSFGAFFPTMSDNSWDMYMISNYYRWPQAIGDAYTIYSNYALSLKKENNWILRGELGLELWLPKAELSTEVECFMHFGFDAGYRFDNISLWTEFNDMMWLTSEGRLNDRSHYQLIFCSQYDLGKVKPGLFYTLPLKEYIRDYQTGAIGAKLDFTF